MAHLNRSMVAVLLVMALMRPCAVAAGVDAASSDKADAWAAAAEEREARWERLLVFVAQEYPDWSDVDDATYAFVTAAEYGQEEPGTPREYARLGSLYLRDFTHVIHYCC